MLARFSGLILDLPRSLCSMSELSCWQELTVNSKENACILADFRKFNTSADQLITRTTQGGSSSSSQEETPCRLSSTMCFWGLRYSYLAQNAETMQARSRSGEAGREHVRGTHARCFPTRELRVESNLRAAGSTASCPRGRVHSSDQRETLRYPVTSQKSAHIRMQLAKHVLATAMTFAFNPLTHSK